LESLPPRLFLDCSDFCYIRTLTDLLCAHRSSQSRGCLDLVGIFESLLGWHHRLSRWYCPGYILSPVNVVEPFSCHSSTVPASRRSVLPVRFDRGSVATVQDPPVVFPAERPAPKTQPGRDRWFHLPASLILKFFCSSCPFPFSIIDFVADDLSGVFPLGVKVAMPMPRGKKDARAKVPSNARVRECGTITRK
jgi:hypothetical protein